MDRPEPQALEQALHPLWLRAQAGDEQAYRQALELMASRLRGYFARRLSDDIQSVEDLVQEVLLALHLQRGTYDESVPVTAWMHGIARHKYIDHVRRRGRSEAVLEPLDALDESAHPATTEEAGTRRDLALLLDTLPPAHRQAIVHTRIEGLSVAEAALRAGVSESVIKVHVHRGLKRLARLIGGGA